MTTEVELPLPLPYPLPSSRFGFDAKDREIIVATLREVKEMLWNGRGVEPVRRSYICLCFEDARPRRASDSLIIDFENYVAACLGGRSSLDTWMRARNISATYPQIQAARQAWLDQLIAQFEA